MRKLMCFAAMAAMATSGAFAYNDEWIQTSDDSVVRYDLPDGSTTYAFTNVVNGLQVNPVGETTLTELLVVGGGGAGGGTIGGGGGGGGVVKDLPAVPFKGATISVGAGGQPSSDVWNTGSAGGKSVLTLAEGGGEYLAYGGGPGRGWDGGNLAEATDAAPYANGGGGAGANQSGGKGFDHTGGNSLACGGNDNAPGGGAGAGGNGEDGQATKRAGQGGPGVISSITGEPLDYGAGGGGGGGNAIIHSVAGGPSAGDGGLGSNEALDRKPTVGENGLDGRGGGGGGGAFTGSTFGGKGGTGAVIIRLTPEGKIVYQICVDCPDEDAKSLAERAVVAGVTLLDPGAAYASQAPSIDCVGCTYAPVAYRVDERTSSGWSEGERVPVTGGSGSCAGTAGDGVMNVRVTWFYRVTEPRLDLEVAEKSATRLAGAVTVHSLMEGTAALKLQVFSDSEMTALHAEKDLGGSHAAGAVVNFETTDLPEGGVYYACIRATDAAATGISSIMCRIAGGAYVSATGSDGRGVGTAENPFRSLSKAMDSLGNCGTINIGAGTYSPSLSGETFDFALAGSTTVTVWSPDGSPAEVILDAEQKATHLFTAASAVDLALGGLAIRNTTDSLIQTTGGTVTLEGVTATQALEGSGTSDYSSPLKYNTGVIRTTDATAVTLRDCTVTGIRRDTAVQLHYTDDMLSDVVMEHCTFAHNTVKFGLIAETSGKTSKLRGNYTDCVFDDNEITNEGQQHDVYGAAVFWARGTSNPAQYTMFDRCRFTNLRGRAVISGNRTALRVYNSYFADCPVTGWTFGGYNASAAIANCTFVRCAGGFANRLKTTITDSIFSEIDQLTFSPQHYTSQASDLTLKNVILHDAGLGLGYNEAASTVLTTDDPLLENERPLPYSPAIDAGVGGVLPTTSATDLAGNPRVADNSDSGTPRLDLGCYESTFRAEPGPGFIVPVPGLGSGFAGQTYTLPVSLQNADGATFPLTASVAYADGLTGDATLTFASAGDAQELTFTAASVSEAKRSRLTISADGFAPVSYDFDIGTVQVSLGGLSRRYVRVGEDLELPLTLALAGATSPVELSVELTDVTGDAASAQWTGGNTIAVGASASEGHLALSGLKPGVTKVTAEASAPFVESGETTFTLEVVVYPNELTVDAAEGSDDEGDGVTRPFATLGRAVGLARSGDTVVVKPGVYSASAGETFPIRLDGVKLVGEEGAVLDAENQADYVVEISMSGSADNLVAGLTLRNSRQAAVRVSESTATIRGCTFTQSQAKGDQPGGVQSYGYAFTTVEGCTFRGMTRRACCLQSAPQDVNEKTADLRKLTVRDSLFESNTVYYAAVSADITGFVKNVELTGCTFRGNVNSQTGELRVAWPCSCVYLYGGSSNFRSISRCLIDGCRFYGNRAASTLAFDCLQNTAFVNNSVFADEETTDGVFGTAYTSALKSENCTFIRNSGGYHVATIDNAIFVDDTGLGSKSRNNGSAASTLRNAWLYRSEKGDQSQLSFTGALTEGVDPLFRNAGVSSADPAFDARLKPYSPCVDAGDSSLATTETDCAGNPRVADNLGGGACVDYGAYEETFYAEPRPTFRVERPGFKTAFTGMTTPVSLSLAGPGLDGLEWPVTAAVACPAGVTADPAEVVFSSADETKVVRLAVSSEMAEGTHPIVFSDASGRVAEGAIDLVVGKVAVTVDLPARAYLRSGGEFRYKVKMSPAGALAPQDVAVTLGSASGGTAKVSWEGDALIRAGETESDGTLVVRPGDSGVTQFGLEAGVPFAGGESGERAFEVVSYPGCVYVDPETGSDAGPEGTEADPFKTIGAALAIVTDEDEIRLLPGTYSADSGEVFPLDPRGVSLVGWENGAPAAAGRVVIDGGNAVESVVTVGGTKTTSLGHLALRETTGALVSVGDSSVALEDCLFTQSQEDVTAEGGLSLNNKSHGYLKRCRFEGIRRKASVYLASASTDNVGATARTFVADETAFVSNHSAVAAVGSGYGGGSYGLYAVSLTNCLFEGNTAVAPYTSSSQSNRIWDSYPTSALLLIQGIGSGGNAMAPVSIDRTRFIGNAGGHLIAGDWCLVNNGPNESPNAKITNCLFMDNAPVLSMFWGYKFGINLHHCSFVGNDGTYTGNGVMPIFYNCLFANEKKPIKAIAQWASSANDKAKLYATLLYNTERDDGVVKPLAVDDESKIVTGDPLLKKDGSIKYGSVAINAGDPRHVLGAYDLFGNPRVVGRAPDLGCAENAGLGLILFVR